MCKLPLHYLFLHYTLNASNVQTDPTNYATFSDK